MLHKMNRLDEFYDCARAAGREATPPIRPQRSAFIIRCAEINLQISAFDDLLTSIFDTFVGYHCCLADRDSNHAGMLIRDMNEKEREELNTEITRFVATSGAELKVLRKMDTTEVEVRSAESSAHASEVINQLTARLSNLTHRCHSMHSERLRLAKFTKPFNFYAIDQETFADEPIGPTLQHREDRRDADDNSFLSRIKASASTEALSKDAADDMKSNMFETKEETEKPRPLGEDFAKRFEGKIAPLKQLKRYEQLAHQHKSALLKESRLMHVRYHESFTQAQQMEKSVNSVSALMTQFANILAEQSEGLEEVRAGGKSATDHVKESAEELQLTIDRSENHSNNIVMLSVGLAFLLLFLDFVTP